MDKTQTLEVECSCGARFNFSDAGGNLAPYYLSDRSDYILWSRVREWMKEHPCTVPANGASAVQGEDTVFLED